MAEFITSDYSRMWIIEGRAGVGRSAVYQGLWKAGTPNLPTGDVTTIFNPDPDRYGSFRRVGKLIGAPDDPTLPVMARYESERRSLLLKLARNACDHDIQIHMGNCQDPKDFNGGWDKILVLESGRPDGWTTDNDLGALGPDERSVVNEQSTFTGLDLYEIVRIRMTELAASQVTGEIVDVVVCDRVSCGSCGIPSDGCDKVFAVSVSGTGSPSGLAGLLYTGNGGGVWGLSEIDSLGIGDDPTALACVGSYLVVVSNDSQSLHYALLADILAGTEDWTEVTTGISVGLNAVVSLGPTNVWVVGDGGYIYFTSNVEDGLTELDAGVTTSQNLNDIAAFDVLNLVAVGASNVVLNSRDGGTTWSLIVGPAAGVVINTVAMKSADEWLVGLANGTIYGTRDAGVNWTLIGTPAGTTSVNNIRFASESVGYAAVNTATAGRVLRTINGGASWYVAPEGSSRIPANDRVNAVAVCEDVNVVFGGGLADNATDGFLVKGA